MSDNLERYCETCDLIGEVKEDTADLRLRFAALEPGYASMSIRLDRLAGEVERIKRRLALTDA